jgi:membrane-associated phospholipid phosphatase
MKLLALTLLALCVVCFASNSNTNDKFDNDIRDYLTKREIAEWHDKIYYTCNILGAPGGGSSGLRAWTMMVLAMFDASNIIDQEYTNYLVQPNEVPVSIIYSIASRRAAVAKAAQVVLDGVFLQNATVAQQPVIRYAHAAQLNLHIASLDPLASSTVHGLALGEYVGNRILAARVGDGHIGPAELPVNGSRWDQYQYGLPYYPGNAQSKNYIRVKPFAIWGYGIPSEAAIPDPVVRAQAAALTFVPPPPRNDTAEWNALWDELYNYGVGKPLNTPATTATARFHDGNFGSQIGNMADILSSSELPIRSTDLLRVIALTALSSHDAHANHWFWKFHYLFGRPITMYRQVPVDEPSGNGLLRDEAWAPSLTTSQNPEYPSGHACRSGGMMLSLRRAFGDNLTFRTISYSSPTAPARTYSTFTSFYEEVLISRTYGGVHWRSAGSAGKDVSQRIVNYIWDRFLTPI